MTEQAKPAAAPTPAPAAQFNDDTLIPVPGGMEPLKNIRAALTERSQLRAQVDTYTKRQDDLRFVDTLREDYARDPKAAMDNVKRMLGVNEPEVDDDADPAVKRVAQLERQLETLTRTIRSDKTETQRERSVREATEAVDTYSSFKAENEIAKRARDKAIRNVLMAKAAGDQRPIKDIAAEEHKDFYDISVAKATDHARAHDAAVAAEPVLPIGQDGATLTPPPKVSWKEVKERGGMEKLIADGLARGGMAALGFKNRIDNRRT